jgi:hypothetical protein
MAPKYLELSVHLLGDSNAEYVESIESNFRKNVDKTTEIVKEWIHGRSNAKPCTWWSLIETLKDMQLSTIAEEIQETLLGRNYPMQLQARGVPPGQHRPILKPSIYIGQIRFTPHPTPLL